MERNLIMLGTGNAMVTKCYNTCFAVQNGEEYLLVDAGGGAGWRKPGYRWIKSVICLSPMPIRIMCLALFG